MRPDFSSRAFDVLRILEVHDGDTFRFLLDTGFEVAAFPWLRLNRQEYCQGCGTMVNPYVVERKPETNWLSDPTVSVMIASLECPNCEYKWKQEYGV